jgi:ribose transport system permease protein
MSDRIVVMRRGELATELPAAEADEETLLAAAIGERSAASSPERSAASSPERSAASSPSQGGPSAAERSAARRAWRFRQRGVFPSAAERRDAGTGGGRLGSSRAGQILASNLTVYLALVALFAAGVVASGSFLGLYNLTSIVRHAVALGIVAFGQAVVMLAGGVDLSVSSTITLTTILSAGLMAGRNAMILPAVLACLVVGLAFGAVNGVAVVMLRIPPFIATLGVLSIGRGVVLLITHGPVGAIGGAFRSLARGSVGPIPSALVIIVALIVLTSLLMNRTRYGRHLFAIGGDREVARLAGIRTRALEFTTYLVSGASAVLAGLYLTSRMGVGDPSVGPGFELDSIIAVLIGGIPFGGGKGNVVGVFAGVLLLAVLGNLLNVLNLHSWYHQITKAAILLIAISLVRKEK